MSSELTKVAVEKVTEITGLKAQTVRELLETGWSFTWDIKGNYRWDRNEHQDLVVNTIGPLVK